MTTMIAVERLSKQYRLGSRRGEYSTLRDTLSQVARAAGRRLLPSRRREPATASDAGPSAIWALKDVSLEIPPGEVVGIIGHNGAGKSTLLKILSRITEPTSGRAVTRGRVGSLLEVGTGFHPELTGRENIYLTGAILNMSRHEIQRKFDAIVDFAEIKDFIDTPVKRYSSGMYVRLGFAVAAHMTPDVLLVDEVLAVGDMKFQRKCMEHARRLRESNATVVIVSHNMFSIKAMCTRVIYLSRGEVLHDGSPQEAIALYEKESQLMTLPWAQGLLGTDVEKFPVFIRDVEYLDEQGRACAVFDHGQRMRIRLHYDAPQRVSEPNFVVAFIRNDNVTCCNFCTEVDSSSPPWIEGRGALEVHTPPLKLVSEGYTTHVLVWARGFERLLCAQVGPGFQVRDPLFSTHFGVFHEPAEKWLHTAGTPGGCEGT